MAYIVHVAGKALIKVGTGEAGELEDFGYTRNGAECTFEGFWIDVPGDEYAGDEGPPIDIQYVGEIARVRLEMTKWDVTIADKIAARVNAAGVTTGAIGPGIIGDLMITNDYYMRLAIATGRNPMNFPVAIPRMPIEINKGTKFSTMIVEFECHRNPDGGVLYNSDIGGEVSSGSI